MYGFDTMTDLFRYSRATWRGEFIMPVTAAILKYTSAMSPVMPGGLVKQAFIGQ